MLRTSKAANTGERKSGRRPGAAATNCNANYLAPAAIPMDGRSALSGNVRSGAGNVCSMLKGVSLAPAQGNVLSVRAENVLKEWAATLTGEDPPKGRWVPSGSLLRKLSYRDLQVARNCGPQTTDEIIRWAKSQGLIVERPFHIGKSLPEMWRDIIARSSTGEFTKAEIAEALERSLRRKNIRIPVAFQNLLVKVLNAGEK